MCHIVCTISCVLTISYCLVFSNKVFLDPVRYRCGHYFCGSCADTSGTKCGSCNVPSLKSEIQSDCIVSNIVENFQTLCQLINFEKYVHICLHLIYRFVWNDSDVYFMIFTFQ